MKHFFFIFFIFLISGCALVKDFQQMEFNWLGDPNHPSFKNRKVTAPEERPVEVKKEVPHDFKEGLRGNWLYAKDQDHIHDLMVYSATTFDISKKASLTLLRSQNKESAVIELTGEKVSYRAGHSIEVKLDDKVIIQEVEPSKGEASSVVRIKNAKEFGSQLQGKQNLKVELHTIGEGPKIYEFNISGLEDY